MDYYLPVFNTHTYSEGGKGAGMKRLHRIESIWCLFESRYEHRCAKLKVLVWKKRVRQFENKNKIHELEYFGANKREANNNFHPIHISCCILVLELKWMWTNVITARNVTNTHSQTPTISKILPKLNGYHFIQDIRTRTKHTPLQICEKPIDTSVHVMCAWWLSVVLCGWYILIFLFVLALSLSPSQLYFLFWIRARTILFVFGSSLSFSCIFTHIHSFRSVCIFHNERTSITRTI